MLVNEWEATVLNIYLNLISRNIIVSVELYCAVLLPQIKIQTTLNIFPWEGYSVFWTSKLLKIILPHQLLNPSELTLRIVAPAWTSSCMNGKIMWCIVNVLHYNVGTRPNSGSRAAWHVPLQLIHGDASLGSDQKLRATPRQSYCWIIVATRYIGKMTLELHVTPKL